MVFSPFTSLCSSSHLVGEFFPQQWQLWSLIKTLRNYFFSMSYMGLIWMDGTEQSITTVSRLGPK
jgi:hypothetical protein